MTLPLAMTAGGVLDAYVKYCQLTVPARDYRRSRIKAAEDFMAAHPDLAAWMSEPLDARLAELHRRNLSWPFVAYALMAGVGRADIDFLAAKHFGHSMGQAVTALYPTEIDALVEAGKRLGMTDALRSLVTENLPLAVAFCGSPPAELTESALDALGEAIDATPMLTEPMRRRRKSRLFGLRRILYEAGLVDTPAVHRRNGGPAGLADRLQAVAAAEIRRTMAAYLEARATVLRPATIAKMIGALARFGEFLTAEYPQVTSLRQLERQHVEGFLVWSATRMGRGGHAHKQVGPYVTHHAVIILRNFLDDISDWGWAQSPSRRLVFKTDIPSTPQALPRALAPDVDAAIMTQVAALTDPFARVGLTVMRHTGLRVGELLDLELDCVVDYGTAGSWLRVPLGKLNNERSVPLDDTTLGALDEWMSNHRRHQRAMSHPRHGHLADFVFVEQGRRLSPRRLQQGLKDAVVAAGLTGPDGQPLHVVSHQLRHTYATSMVNAGMSLQALMALLGHRSPEMTLRYATLASPTLRRAYEEAIGKLRPRILITPVGAPAIPERVEWLQSELLKTRVAHGYCARELVAEACPYANICETCPNFISGPEFTHALQAQLADIHVLRQDAHNRGWKSEVARHDRVIDSLQGHLRRLENEDSP